MAFLQDGSVTTSPDQDCLCRTPAKRGPGFTALGDMALALADVGCADEMRKVAPRMAEQIREAISAQRGRKGVFCPEALQVPC